MVEGTAMADLSLEDVIKKTWKQTNEVGVFNNAAQVWNHTFYWNCMSPGGGGNPTGKAAEAIGKSFGDFASFKDKFSTAAAGRFGSGWAWLVGGADGVSIETTANADTPMADGKKCLLTLDVWEHAYYVDYRNARPKYIEEFWKLVNWDFVNKNLG
jgi:Fe-Mn family superoxide dismutase